MSPSQEFINPFYNNSIFNTMEVKVTVTHELGEATKAFIASLITGGAVAAAPAKAAPAKEVAPSKEEDTDEDAPKGRSRRSVAAKPAVEEKAPAKEEEEAPARSRSRRPAPAKEEPTFADLSDEEKLDEIKAKITLTTKKKGGADDVRELLGVFGAGRAGELDTKDYDEFYDALTQYRAGKSIDELYPQVD